MPSRVSQMGSTGGVDNLGKMTKNCMKMTKSAFLGQNSGGGHGGTSPPIGETLPSFIIVGYL